MIVGLRGAASEADERWRRARDEPPWGRRSKNNGNREVAENRHAWRPLPLSVVDVLWVSDAVGIDAEEGIALGQAGRVVYFALPIRAAVL